MPIVTLWQLGSYPYQQEGAADRRLVIQGSEKYAGCEIRSRNRRVYAIMIIQVYFRMGLRFLESQTYWSDISPVFAQ